MPCFRSSQCSGSSRWLSPCCCTGPATRVAGRYPSSSAALPDQGSCLFTVPQQVVTRDAHKIPRTIAYRIDAVGVHTTHGFSTDTLPWSAIKAVRRARGQILLSHRGLSGGKRRMNGIPTADLTTAEQSRLLAVLRSRGAALTNAPAS